MTNIFTIPLKRIIMRTEGWVGAHGVYNYKIALIKLNLKKYK